MKKLIAAVIAAISLEAAPVAASSLSEIENNTAILYHNNQSICSSEFITVKNKSYLITANHCHTVEDDNYTLQYNSLDKDGKIELTTIYPLDFVTKDEVHDISVFKVRFASFKPDGVDLATAADIKNLTKGDPVLTAGYPGSDFIPMKDLVYTNGLYVGEAEAIDPTINKLGGKFYRTTAPIFYGNSGGGMYIKVGEEYKLLGVTSQLDPENKTSTSEFGELTNILEKLNASGTN